MISKILTKYGADMSSGIFSIKNILPTCTAKILISAKINQTTKLSLCIAIRDRISEANVKKTFL